MARRKRRMGEDRYRCNIVSRTAAAKPWHTYMEEPNKEEIDKATTETKHNCDETKDINNPSVQFDANQLVQKAISLPTNPSPNKETKPLQQKKDALSESKTSPNEVEQVPNINTSVDIPPSQSKKTAGNLPDDLQAKRGSSTGAEVVLNCSVSTDTISTVIQAVKKTTPNEKNSGDKCGANTHTISNANGDATKDKHEAARRYALSGELSKFQKSKLQRGHKSLGTKAIRNLSCASQPVNHKVKLPLYDAPSSKPWANEVPSKKAKLDHTFNHPIGNHPSAMARDESKPFRGQDYGANIMHQEFYHPHPPVAPPNPTSVGPYSQLMASQLSKHGSDSKQFTAHRERALRQPPNSFTWGPSNAPTKIQPQPQSLAWLPFQNDYFQGTHLSANFVSPDPMMIPSPAAAAAMWPPAAQNLFSAGNSAGSAYDPNPPAVERLEINLNSFAAPAPVPILEPAGPVITAFAAV